MRYRIRVWTRNHHGESETLHDDVVHADVLTICAGLAFAIANAFEQEPRLNGWVEISRIDQTDRRERVA